ncbi:MAG: HNH endonuclease domain-containing protein [Chitinophagaceae bacterium]
MKKKILGLDLGTNSIGWALIDQDFENKLGFIYGMGSRIIPMSQDILGKFDSGVSISQTAERTGFRGVRRLRERHLLRRERLHRVLNILNFLPEHYRNQIDFEKKLGQYKTNTEPKLVYDENNLFIFKTSFEEMVAEFKKSQPQLFYTKANGKETLIPYDWTIYYLRKKALIQKIEKEELAWLLLNYNQKRGYFQLRGEGEEELPNKKVEFHSLKVVDVTADGQQKGKTDIWYNITLENGWIYRRASKLPLFDWKNKTKEFVVSTDLNDDGSEKFDKDGKIKRSFRAPAETDWTLVKTKTEQTIDKSGKTVGQYIYDTLLQNPTQKINGKLVRVIERKFYKKELEKILKTQQTFHAELQDEKLYRDCIEELYTYNESHRKNISNRNFVHLFLNDIIFYQRPLKSKKSLISDCKFESRKYIKNGVEQHEPLKCIAKSHPLFQEFRLWQWIKNLHIFEIENDEFPITEQFLKSEEDYVQLFDFLNDKKEIEQDILIKFLLTPLKLKQKELKQEIEKYRWNYVQDKSYPCNTTRYLMLTKLDKCKNISANFLTKENEEQLWHILYSVNNNEEIDHALKKFANKHGLENNFVEQFNKFPPLKNEYGSYSYKAIKKLLPLMRMGKYWKEENIHIKTKNRIDKIITGEYDETIKSRVREKALHFSNLNQFKGLPLWLVSYIVYDQHAEESNLEIWKTPQDIEDYLKSFKQHSLRNPIVEQVITETLRVVKDIWNHYGNSKENFFDEIHIELGREMKNDKKERERLTKVVTENENTNLRIKALLAEMMNYKEVENVRPYSPMQQEILKIYEEGVLNSGIEIDDDILKISKSAQPSKADLLRYKLWLEQKYRSPYTGDIIPLNKLFTPDYEIEHIIPQSRYFDDSYSNKVICESEVNKDKDNLLAFEYISNNEGKKIELSGGKFVTLFTTEQFQEFIKTNYVKNHNKSKKLLLLDIPEKMIERQMNDTRYISKEVKNILSKVVRQQNDKDQGITANNLLSTNGQITATLKQDWGLNDIWNELIAPRFERLNAMTNSKNFGDINPKTNKFLPTVPIELSKGFRKKRIDHRHHALDALVIACATRDHVNLLNNQSAKSDTKRYDLQHKLRHTEKWTDKNGNIKDKFTEFKKPWESFTKDAKEKLETIVISFKQNLRVINKTVNKYQRWENVNGTMEKVIATQTKGDSWAIRKPLHKDTVSGKVVLQHVKLAKDRILTATRKNIDTSFNLKTIASITDTGIQKILKNYLEIKGGNPEIVFTQEGIEEMNKNISQYNDGKKHQPIVKVRIYEQGTKFSIGSIGNKNKKYVEGAKGTNLFFAIYKDEKGKRNYTTIPFNEVVEIQKQSAERKEKPQSVPLKNEKGDDLIFHLSPNDLVYVPTKDEIEDATLIDFRNLNKEQVNRIYKCVSFSGNQCFYVKNDVATSIVNKVEYSALNKLENSIEGIQIKSCCWKIEMDRLGHITKVIK